MFLRQISLLFLITALVSGLGGNELNGQTIAAGHEHSLAIKEDGTVVAWGKNDYNQCDVPSGLKDVVAIRAARRNSLALKEDGTVVAWGWDEYNVCDVPSGLNDVVAIEAGGSFSLALKEDGTVVAWGYNYDGQCDVPSGLKHVVAIETGDAHSLALKEDGTVVAWGDNTYWQCEVPSGLKDVVAIEGGSYHSLALKEDGTIVVLGMTDYDVPSGLKDVVAITAGYCAEIGYHNLALKEDGSVVAWGGNDYNQSDVPIGLKDVIAIEAGDGHSLALKEDGTVVAWGKNDDNQCDVPRRLRAALPPTSEISFSNEPPILSIDRSTILFSDANQNQALDAFEEATVEFELRNLGPGSGRRLSAQATITGNTNGITIQHSQSIATIPSNESAVVSFALEASRFSQDGRIQISVEVIEPNGFSPEPLTIEIETRAFRAPKIEVVDFSSSPSTWKPNTSIGLDLLVQNTGLGLAENLKMELTLPDAVNCYSNNTSIEITALAPGETIPITYDMMVPRNFDQSSIQANLTVTENFGDYGTTWTHSFPFEGGSSKGAIVSIDAMVADGVVSTERATLNRNYSGPSDVTFNKTDKEHNITAVAVIGKMVTGCDGNSKSADELASYTENNVLAHYEVIERRHFEDLLNEHRLQMSGLTFEETLIEKGCIENAQGYLFVESGCLMGDEMIQLKLVHCESSDLVWSCTGINATAQETLEKVREELEKE